METIFEIKKQIHDAVKKIGDLGALEKLETEYLGRKGKLTEVLRGLKDKTEAERKKIGKAANDLKIDIEKRLSVLRNDLERGALELSLRKERIDVTAPGARVTRGSVHPLTLARREINDIFSRMGFAVVDGPEVESEWNNFDALNIPLNHPAREMWDTFWLKGKDRLLMRTHTSPVQIRYMQTHKPPFKIIVPGRSFRYEATDATHDFQFWQFEGLVVGRDVTAANFKYTVEHFFREFFKTKIDVRLRPSYFPFTEPSFEVDLKRANGAWLEVGGAGMVHPEVLRNVGIDPNEWQGLAVGWGVDRLALLKYKIPDIRYLRNNDPRFLKQFARKK